MQIRISHAEHLLYIGELKQAESLLRELICEQEQLVEDGNCTPNWGNAELSKIHSTMAEVMCLQSHYRLAYTHSQIAFSLLLADSFPYEHRLVKQEEGHLRSYWQYYLTEITRNMYDRGACAA